MALTDADRLQMTTLALLRHDVISAAYKPSVWNDSGVYSYFYIDFGAALESFSLGMFNESIVVHDSLQLSVTSVVYVSPGVYKVYCDISNKMHGVTVLNKKTSLLYYAAGGRLPIFSVHFYVSGIVAYIQVKYIYESSAWESNVEGIYTGNYTEAASVVLT